MKPRYPPSGAAIVTTPNVDNAPARVKFLLKGKLRAMDEWGDSTHISPIFWDLLTRRYLPRVGLEVVERLAFPPTGYLAGRAAYSKLFGTLSPILRGFTLRGDNHVIVLSPAKT